MTPEEKKFQQAENNAAGALVTLQWLQTETGSRFIQNTYNADLIQKWLTRHGKEWSLENLEEAFLACESQMLAKNPTPEAAPIPEPEPPKPPTPQELYGPWARVTKEKVSEMLAIGEYKKAMHDPRFVRKVNDLQIKRGEI